MSHPAFRDAGHDPLLLQRGALASLYVYLCNHLDFVEYRRVKARKVAEELRLKRQTVGTGLTELCEAGYLKKGPRLLGTATYRLLYNRSNGPQRGQSKSEPV